MIVNNIIISIFFVFVLQGYNVRDTALDDMMDGVLEVKKEDILKMVGQNIHIFNNNKTLTFKE